ncbi:UNVERIFIED_CONTAM: hypothetical protein K2H54_046497 [Gekko kuhli]
MGIKPALRVLRSREIGTGPPRPPPPKEPPERLDSKALGLLNPQAERARERDHFFLKAASTRLITAPDEDVLVKGKQSIKSQALGNQNSESEILLEGDDDTLSSVEEKELENLTGPVSLSTSAQLVAPCVALKGTLSITTSELYFEVDEEDPGFKKIDPKEINQASECAHAENSLLIDF